MVMKFINTAISIAFYLAKDLKFACGLGNGWKVTAVSYCEVGEEGYPKLDRKL